MEFCKERLIHLQNNADGNLYSDGLKNDGKEILPRITDDMQNSRLKITNTQTQTIQKSWKMNVSSIVAVDNMNSNYDQSSSHI